MFQNKEEFPPCTWFIVRKAGAELTPAASCMPTLASTWRLNHVAQGQPSLRVVKVTDVTK